MTTPENTTGTKSLVSKLAEVMKEVSKIPKNGKNTFHNYKYVMESDLVEAIRDKLADRHIFITSSTKGIETVELSRPTKGGEIVTQKIGVLRVEYTFHDGESGEKLTMEGAGEIDQDGGKGLYKALTGAMKYFLMKQFLVATGDDPEQTPQQKSAPEKKPAPAKVAKPAEKPVPSTPEQQARILDLARELGMEVQRDICAKAGWVWPLTGPQAVATITRLEQKKEQIAKELEREVNEARLAQQVLAEESMAKDERAGMAT